MKIENRWTGKVIWEGDASDIKKAVDNALKTGAVLRGADLTGAVLTGAVLRGAELTGAVLTGAVLRGADLTGAVLTGAVLRDADLTDADLRGADLTGAVLRGADLTDAVLTGAVLRGAVLTGAVLRGADLTDAVLTDAVLRDADLTGAVLRGAVLTGAELTTGETFGQYLSDVVPALLAAGGKSVAQIVQAGAWKCHEWTNCPMAMAFSIHSENDAPLLLRPRVRQFVQLFDAGLIPEPAVEPSPETDAVSGTSA